jgi:hypothetical protein
MLLLDALDPALLDLGNKIVNQRLVQHDDDYDSTLLYDCWHSKQ